MSIKNRVVAVCIIGAQVVAATPLIAQGPTTGTLNADPSARQCNSALAEGNIAEARRLADRVLDWETVTTQSRLEAERCLNAVYETQYQWYPALQKFATTTEIEEFQAEQEVLRNAQEVRRSQEALREVLGILSDAYDTMNRNLVAASVYDACLNLLETDPNSAHTNDTCVASFMQNGHPELESFAEFAVSASPLALERLSTAQRALLERLDQEQVEELCEGEFAALCTLAGVGE